jgi:hypothetical protein
MMQGFKRNKGELCRLAPHELIVVVTAHEERLFLKEHAGEHAAQAPQVQRVVVIAQPHLGREAA